MWPRILLGGVLGGIVVFCMGAFNHMALGLQGRTILNLPDEPALVEFLKAQGLRHGLYAFPGMPKEGDEKDSAAKDSAAKESTAKDQAKVYAEINERYKAGPAGLLLIAPTGEDMMGPKTLGLELATDVVAALAAAWIVSLFGPEVRFGRRWLAVLLMGLFAWFSLTASYGIWYRFPHDFVHDELLCAALEWGVAGLAIAAIVRPKALAAPAHQPSEKLTGT